MSWAKKCRKYLLSVLFIVFCFGSTVQAKSNLWYYGDQLTGISKEIYTALQKVPDMKKYHGADTIKVKANDKGIEIKLKKSYSLSQNKKLFSEVDKAGDAFLRDRSDLFWISSFKFTATSSSYARTFDKITVYPIDYYNGIRKEIPNTQKALNRIINYVKKQKNRYEKVKAAHDYIIDLVTYSKDDLKSPYYHTVTGGLLAKYGHKGVCEVYAKLFDIVCKANHIPSVLITYNEICGNKIYSRDHIWNYVQMNDGKWYVVDVTFDDPIMSDGSQGKFYDYFLVGSNASVNGGRIKETHTGSGYSISTVSVYKPFKLPKLAKKSFF